MDFSAYAHALAAVLLFSLLSMVLAFNSVRGRTAEDRAPCGKPKRNYSNLWYRSERAFANAVENAGPFIGATLVAILVGANPLAVNVLACLFLVGRLAMALVHIMTENQGARSACFAVATLANLALVLIGLWGALSL